MRTPIIAGNWKMNLLPDEASELVEGIWDGIRGVTGVEVVVCPPFLSIPAVRERVDSVGMNILLGAQNMHWEDKGAYTGEISPLMLKAFGVTHVILGHSERRQYFGETDQGVNRKVSAALAHGLVPIVCVGETLKERESGHTREVVISQVKRGLFDIPSGMLKGIIIAYEPVWAIGTGKAAVGDDAQEVAHLIREVLAEISLKEVADSVRIQYGGSVSPDNVEEFLSQPDIDGALVGGASLKAEIFSELVRKV